MFRGWSGYGPFADPGPCPVDDTPHTACTPESVGALVVPVRQTAAMRRAAALAKTSTPTPPPVEDLPPVAFTPKTYRRAVHGTRLRGTRQTP